MNILLVLEIDSNRLKEASVTEAMYEYHLPQKISVHKSGKIRQINAPKGLLLSKHNVTCQKIVVLWSAASLIDVWPTGMQLTTGSQNQQCQGLKKLKGIIVR